MACDIALPEMCVRTGVRYVLTLFSGMDGLPNFPTHGAPLRARFARAGAPLLCPAGRSGCSCHVLTVKWKLDEMSWNNEMKINARMTFPALLCQEILSKPGIKENAFDPLGEVFHCFDRNYTFYRKDD